IEKDDAKANLNKETILPTTALEKTIIPPVTITTYSLIIPTTLPFQPPFLSRPPKTTHQLKREQVKKDKGKKEFSHEEVEEEESESNSEAEVRLIGSLVESSKKTLKKFAYINEQGETCLMIEEEIKNQKKIEQTVKANVAKDEIKQGKEELIDLLGFDVVVSMYKAKIKYDKYCIKMLNTRAQGKITNYDVLSRGKGTITLKVNTDDGFDEIIQNFKASDLHLGEWREVMKVCPHKTRAGWTTIYSQIKHRLENLHKIDKELELNFSKPL
ncbi:hypothetical protein Tco_1295657, partial [Tanacetum coccineum]